jgi:GNAT superfamily N-acetyltransferase
MSEITYRKATRDEFDIACDWAAQEGWNPGVEDADIFWATDPDGFVVAERAGEVVATGSIVSYGDFGFMGFFIVRKELRGQGIGTGFWHWRKQELQKRLNPGAAIGMDGVFDMQPFYAKGGFSFTHRNLRVEGVGRSSPQVEGIVGLASVPFDKVAAMDKHCFGFARNPFLKRWITPKHGLSLGKIEGDRLSGFGVIRKCLSGYKVGPLFADNPDTAEAIFLALGNYAAGEPVFLDTPEK